MDQKTLEAKLEEARRAMSMAKAALLACRAYIPEEDVAYRWAGEALDVLKQAMGDKRHG